MEILKMSDDERAEFLARPYVAVLAVDEPGWSPHVAPVWFHHLPAEDKFLVATASRSKKVRLHKSGTGELSLCVEAIEGTAAKYVNVQGTATLHPLSAERLTAVAEKYLPPENVAAYLADPPEDSMFEITPRRIVTAVIG